MKTGQDTPHPWVAIIRTHGSRDTPRTICWAGCAHLLLTYCLASSEHVARLDLFSMTE